MLFVSSLLDSKAKPLLSFAKSPLPVDVRGSIVQSSAESLCFKALKGFQGIGGLEGENHKRETDCCFRPFSSLPSFHHSLAANGEEDGDERREEERRKGPLLSLLSLLSSSSNRATPLSSNQETPVTRYSSKLKSKVHFFRPCRRLFQQVS